MIKLLGLFLFILSFTALAGQTKAHLQLQGVVPLAYQLEVQFDGENPTAVLKSNSRGPLLPKFEISKTKNSYLISVVHP